MQTTAQDGLLTTDEAARFLGLARQTLETARTCGRNPQLPFVRLSKRAVRYRRSDLLAFIEAHLVGGDPGDGADAGRV